MSIPLLLFSNKKKRKDYAKMVADLGVLLHYRMEEAGGTTIYDATGRYNGVGSGLALGQFGRVGFCPRFDGASSYINLYSLAFANAFNGSEGMMACFARAVPSLWTDGTVRRVAIIRVDADNQVLFTRTAVNNVMQLYYEAGNITKNVNSTSLNGTTGWFHLAITWSFSNNLVVAYIDGVPITSFTGLGVWAGVPISTRCIIGADTLAPANVWNGWIDEFVVATRAFPQSDITLLANP